ncbi:hypothetical protein BJ170DRAFT_728199 [Xylariales sp. AK1849]|nr:hypothetical protein BJ170DRAFT_728199 [Xylariales sp. AK1849]
MPYCYTCKKMFVDAKALRCHLQYSSEHPDKAYCDHCNVWYEDDEDLYDHYLNSQRHRSCDFCNLRFVDGYAQQQHLRDSPRHRDNYCGDGYCKRYFEGSAELRTHVERHHKHMRYKCDQTGCNLDFFSRSALENHKESQHHRCGFCWKEFTKAQLETHLLFVEFYCRTCNKRYSSLDMLKTHRQTSNNHYWCSSCGDDYHTAAEFQEHCKKFHFYCEKCDLSLVSEDQRITHLVESSNHYYCRRCDKDFPAPDALVKHLDSGGYEGSTRKHYYCLMCHADFDGIDALHNHYFASNVHHCCPICFYQFARRDELTTHLKTEVETHLYCLDCNASLGTLKKFRAHYFMSDAHIYCYTCDEHYDSKAALRRHLQENQESHPYCKICEVTFKTGEELYMHNQQNPREHFHCQRCDMTLQCDGNFIAHKACSDNHHFCVEYREEFEDGLKLKDHYLSSDAHRYCYACDQHYESTKSLRRHMRDNEDSHHYCEKCDTIFKNDKQFEKHKSQCPVRYPECRRCQMFFDTDNAVVEHKVHSNDHHFCASCNMYSPNAEDLRMHEQEQHTWSSKGEHKDLETSLERQPMKEVVVTKLSTEKYSSIQKTCPICQITYSTNTDFSRHYETGDCYLMPPQFHAFIGAEDIQKSFTTALLTEPARSSSLEPVKIEAGPNTAYCCSLCNFNATGKEEVEGHLAGDTHKPLRFACPHDECRLLYPTFVRLLEHLEVTECGAWVRSTEADGLKFLRIYI